MLIHKDTKKPVVVGELVTDFHGSEWYVTGWAEPSRPGASAKVAVNRGKNGGSKDSTQFYASVFGMTWES